MIKVYVAHNMFGLPPDVIMARRNYVENILNEAGLEMAYICNRKDFNKNLSPETIVKTCLAAIDESQVFLMIDPELPGWGKIWEMSYAWRKNIPILLFFNGKKLNPWMYHFATDVFGNLESVIVWIKHNVNENTRTYITVSSCRNRG